MIKLDPEGKAPIVSYNIPEPTSYTGRSFLELNIPDNSFTDLAKIIPHRTQIDSSTNTDELKQKVILSMKTGFADASIFPNARMTTNSLRFSFNLSDGLRPINAEVISTVPTSDKITQLDPDEIVEKLKAGLRLNIFTSPFTGNVKHNFIPVPTEVRPRLFLIETYRLSTFLGDYGAGRVLKTFTLLPGEKTKISVKSYLKQSTESKQSSSILDSVTQESADEFERTLQSEQSNKQATEESYEYHGEIEGEAGWFFASIKASAGFKGGSHAAREEISKSINNATQKHANKASSKRDVQINTSYEVNNESGEETSIEREIQNINLSRTLNFIFRQMNQEFVSLLHLVDIRVGFFNGYAESKREVTLHELDSLLNDYIRPEFHEQIKQLIYKEIHYVFDYKGNRKQFVEEVTLEGDENERYFRVIPDITSQYIEYDGETEKRKFPKVPGIIISVMNNVLRTEGVIVEAILGIGDALDDYAKQQQNLELQHREAEVSRLFAESARAELVNQLAVDENEIGAKILTELTCPCGPQCCGYHCHCRNKEEGNHVSSESR